MKIMTPMIGERKAELSKKYMPPFDVGKDRERDTNLNLKER